MNFFSDDEAYNRFKMGDNKFNVYIDLRDKILFNLGGVVNHELYFNNLSLDKNNIPIGKIKQQIDKQYNRYHAKIKKIMSTNILLI